MVGWLSSIWDYVAAVLTHWVTWVTAVPFFIEQAYSYLPENWRKWADSRWPEPARYKFLKRVALAGFVVASFLAFNDVNERLKLAQQQAGPKYGIDVWQPLSEGESLSLRTQLKKMSPENVSVLCAVPACAPLANSIFDVFSGLNWPGTYESWYLSDKGISIGIEIWSYSKKAKARAAVADAIEQSTNGRLKIAIQNWPDRPMPHSPATRADSDEEKINLVIGRIK